ncbi:LemA family protein [Propionibacterium australiense]|uniref:LemA family n=1 Tax=Propionibacterium australiense TaxID=119981 RepID=A0A383S502_9ACTN|nr:LemA family protein [Propionibacterium australiense]RLP10018.1 LemA family protein [Propionibacterium australiense]RLP11303.1 LemA family protein [Propionibacterium australiense]SYZ32933.1 LemA family [Propionibacterium australiense]VEH92403.1 LemA family [Propionibacterium australiense]
MLIGIIIVLVVLLALAGGLFVGPYNRLVALRNKLQEAWRQVDVELNRRYDLIPSLVETVKGYATHEHNTLSDIIALRNQARSLDTTAAPSAERVAVESRLSGAVGGLIATAEAYPELKADAGFRQLVSELSQTEDRIANSRRYYNAVVGDYNTKVESFPSNIVANMFHFTQAAYFQLDDPTMRANPGVDFSQLGYGSGVQGSQPQTPGQITPGQQPQAPGFQAPGQQFPAPQPQADPRFQQPGQRPPAQQ